MANSVISSIVLPLLGIVIIVVCLLSFIFPYGQRFKDKTQKIKALGVDMEVSVLTLFVIAGVAMASSGVYLRLKDYERQLRSAEANANAMKEALTQAQRLQMKPFITLEGVSANEMPKLADVRAAYFVFCVDRPVEVAVAPGLSSNQFRISLDDMTSKTVIRSLVLEDRATGRTWTFDNFAPLEPLYTLKKPGS